MATFKITNIIKIENKTKQNFSFRPYRQNFIVSIGEGDTLELRTSAPEQSLQYYKSVLPYAEIELVGKFDKQFYNIDTNGFEHGTVSGATEIAYEGMVQLTVEADTGYELPNDVTVIGATKVSFVDGVLTIINPTDDVVITGSCIAIEWTISVDVTNGTYSGDQTISTDGTASVTIVPLEGYDLPDTITINGDTGASGSGSGVTWSYDGTTGEVSLSNPTSVVSITVVCEAEQPAGLTPFEVGQTVSGIVIDPTVVPTGYSSMSDFINAILTESGGNEVTLLTTTDGKGDISAMYDNGQNMIVINTSSDGNIYYLTDGDAGWYFEGEDDPEIINSRTQYTVDNKVVDTVSLSIAPINGVVIGAVVAE